jgi:hypothetical protein
MKAVISPEIYMRLHGAIYQKTKSSLWKNDVYRRLLKMWNVKADAQMLRNKHVKSLMNSTKPCLCLRAGRKRGKKLTRQKQTGRTPFNCLHTHLHCAKEWMYPVIFVGPTESVFLSRPLTLHAVSLHPILSPRLNVGKPQIPIPPE